MPATGISCMSRTALPEFLSNAAVPNELQSVILGLAEVSVTISQALAKGALAGVLGAAGAENVQGEDQKKLDVIANDLIKEALAALPAVRGLASEEEPDVLACHTDAWSAPYSRCCPTLEALRSPSKTFCSRAANKPPQVISCTAPRSCWY